MLFFFTYRKSISDLLGVRLRLLLLPSALIGVVMFFESCWKQSLLWHFILNFDLFINIKMIYIMFQNLVRYIRVLTLSFHWRNFELFFFSVLLSAFEGIFVGILKKCLGEAGDFLNIGNILFLNDLLRPWVFYGNRVWNCNFL